MTAITTQEDYDEILEAIDERLAQSVAPVLEQNKQLRKRMDEMAKPVRQGAPYFTMNGTAPGVRIGEDSLSSRGYSFMRALGLRQGYLRPEDAKIEFDTHQRLMQAYDGLGIGGTSILVPFGSRHMSAMDAPLAEEIRQSTTAGVAGADPEYLGWLRQSAHSPAVVQTLSQFDTTGLGALLGSVQTGELIDLVRANEVFSRAGATELTLPPNGRLVFPRQTGASQAFWVGESQNITDSEPTTGDIILTAKKLAALIKSPNELIRFGSPSVEAFFRRDLARVIALEADLAMLEGVGSTVKPRGLINYSGIVSYTAGTVGADGNTLEPEDPGKMIADVEQNDHDTMNWSWAMRPELFEQLLNRRAGELDSNDALVENVGPFLFSMNRHDIATGQPPLLRGGRVYKSTQISKTRAKGSGDDLTYLLGGDFRQWMVARLGVLEFATSTSGDTPFVKDQTWIRAIQHLDAAPRHEDAFVIADNLLRELA